MSRYPHSSYPPSSDHFHPVDSGQATMNQSAAETIMRTSQSAPQGRPPLAKSDSDVVSHDFPSQSSKGSAKSGARSQSRKKSSTRPSVPPLSIPTQPLRAQPPSPRPPTSASEFRRTSAAPTANNASASGTGAGESPPSVLTREKKQKACANCRKAKLKCIVDEGATECLRCSSRREKCVFYPRAHDEDWQQTLTTDLYGAINHLAQLSHAVSHIIQHLTAQHVIPPLPEPIHPFEPAERDLAFLQGWGAEKNRDLGSERKPAEKRKRGDEDEAGRARRPVEQQRSSNSASNEEGQRASNHDKSASRSANYEQVTASHQNQFFLLANAAAPHTAIRFPPRSSSTYPVNPYTEQPDGPTLPRPQTHMLPPGPLTLPSLQTISPESQHNITPDSQIHSSPTALSKTPGEWSLPHPIPVIRHDASSTSASVEIIDISPSATVEEAERLVDEEGYEVYGSADTRRTVIKDQIVSAVDARRLVGFFHRCLAPNLFGYRLQEGDFPYLADGFRSITPFILAVECLLASERVVEMHETHKPLAEAVMRMMRESPAESWQTFAGSKQSRARTGDEHNLQKAFMIPHEDMDWDPELGIGPEEIVAICALAAFISQEHESQQIAVFGFKWAQGWTEFLRQEPQMTFAEATALVTPLRRPHVVESTRIWLLAYVIAGQQCLQANDLSPMLPLDPTPWCKVVLPDAGPSPTALPHDIILVYHAKLVGQLLNWLAQRSQMNRYTSEHLDQMAKDHIHLASRVNQELDWWALELKACKLAPEWTKQIMLNWLHAKNIVNSLCAQHAGGTIIGEEQRIRCRQTALEMGVELLNRAVNWGPPDTLTHLPEVYFKMIGLAVSNIANAMMEVEEGKIEPSSCPIRTVEALPLLCQTVRVLSSVNLPDGHYVRVTIATIRQHVENLSRANGFHYGLDFSGSMVLAGPR